MSFLLDTNIVSELMKPEPNIKVLSWLSKQSELYITAITQAELLYGVFRMPESKRKILFINQLTAMFEEDFQNKILSFTYHNAKLYAHLTCERDKQGLPIDISDAQIASIALEYDFTLVTRNIKDFVGISGLKLFNPFD